MKLQLKLQPHQIRHGIIAVVACLALVQVFSYGKMGQGSLFVFPAQDELVLFSPADAEKPRAATATFSPVPDEKNEERIDIVVAHCNENLQWLDGFGSCQGVHFHIYSKCGVDNIPTFTKVAGCITVIQIDNCATQEYAFLHYMVDNYGDGGDGGDTTAAAATMAAFVQGGALTENPHLIHDIKTYIKGTTYKSLARCVRGAWHLTDDKVVAAMQSKMIPEILKLDSWVEGWREMFMLSTAKIQKFDKSIYKDMMKELCDKTCRDINCDFETWFGSAFCADILHTGPNCVSHHHGVAPKVTRTDYFKDSYLSTPTAYQTHRKTCTNKNVTSTILIAESAVNGMLSCVEYEKEPTGGEEDNRDTDEYWNTALHYLYDEPGEPDLGAWTDLLTWRYEHPPESLPVRTESAWIDHDKFATQAREALKAKQ